jgi:hypothetical protein
VRTGRSISPTVPYDVSYGSLSDVTVDFVNASPALCW